MLWSAGYSEDAASRPARARRTPLYPCLRARKCVLANAIWSDDKLELAEKTLIIFSSDNGGVANASGDDVGKALAAGLKVNGPLRGGKHDEWEGGFREPFLVRWPGRVPAGATSEQMICLTDVLATLARVLDEPLPKGQAEDSFDVLRAFTEEKPGPPVRDHVILQSAHSTYAIRMGDWKLIERTGGLRR